MDWQAFGLALGGGALIGIAALMLLLFNGRIAGVSGILGGLVHRRSQDVGWRAFFLAGLVAGGLVLRTGASERLAAPELSLPVLLMAGFLVGFGARLGSGCTSGHGVCGIGRASGRSVVATMTFILTGALTVWMVRGGLW